MGFLSASSTFTRYRLIEEVPESLWPEVTERLRKHAFLDIDDTADERSFGWVSIDDMLDTRFEMAPPEKGEYITFALRLDTRRISAAVLKKHVAIAMNQELAKARELGRKSVSRERKKEVREQVQLKLRARSLPVPAQFDVVWNIRTNMIYLASTQPKMRSLFEDMFTLTFDLHLEPLTPYYRAVELLGEEKAAQLDEIEAGRFA
ncbi:recombination-associated protein RdgC [Desulfobaculum bizertense]|uniref:Putative exonuclease, RdgC n=1 Tax=Desulfobaculum bizertense DSM 18034 TaxID=1121442 RepID=A0A1T4VEM2_9BACT|nr:recombination-associated protein RdgC [Desulfobaculum bizertense]UIJ37663.1 recombination-associated protein RdgC [Desulfobaculum bizertense]SKA63356.1 Putative exonuclease, RdgC [Desulfobaculum bizertense DSM 18034]